MQNQAHPARVETVIISNQTVTAQMTFVASVLVGLGLVMISPVAACVSLSGGLVAIAAAVLSEL